MSDTFFGKLYHWPDLGSFTSGITVADRAEALQKIIHAEGQAGRNVAFDAWSLHPRSISILALELAVHAAEKGEALPPALVDVLAWCMHLPSDYRRTFAKLANYGPAKGRPGGLDNARFKVVVIDSMRDLERRERLSTREMQAELKRLWGATISRSHIDAIRAEADHADAAGWPGRNPSV